MFDKLNAVLDRFRELDEAISQPEVIQDYAKYQECLKERSALQPLAEKYMEYLSLLRHREEASELLSDPLLASEAEKLAFSWLQTLQPAVSTSTAFHML